MLHFICAETNASLIKSIVIDKVCHLILALPSSRTAFTPDLLGII